MILSDKTIEKYLDEGKIVILPEFDKADIRPVGIRLHLGSDILVPDVDQTVDLNQTSEVAYKKETISTDGYTMDPGDFILGHTYERFQVPRNIVCQLDGRSTIARLGLSIHCTSAMADGNFEEPRSVVLEIKNNGPLHIRLKPKVAVAMLLFSELSEPIAQDVQKQYQGQHTVAPPNLKSQKQ